VAVKVTDVPAQMLAEGLAAVAIAGITEGLTTTGVVPTALVQPFTVTVTLYVPAIAVVDDAMEGSSSAEPNVAGPAHV